MHKEKIKIKAGRFFLLLINLAVIITSICYIQKSYFDIKNLQFLYEIIIGYGMVSILSIFFYFKRKTIRMYLNCNLNDIDEMTGIEFENFLYYKFKKMGYKAKTTPVTADYGADLVLKINREKIVVQVKRYQRDVGIAAVQEVIGSIAYYKADRGMVITNSYFTPNARNLAKANEITLWDRRGLKRYIIKEEFNWDMDEDNLSNEQEEQYCPKCGKKMVPRTGKYGWFLGCSGYPKCKYTCRYASRYTSRYTSRTAGEMNEQDK